MKIYNFESQIKEFGIQRVKEIPQLYVRDDGKLFVARPVGEECEEVNFPHIDFILQRKEKYQLNTFLFRTLVSDDLGFVSLETIMEEKKFLSILRKYGAKCPIKIKKNNCLEHLHGYPNVVGYYM